MKNVKNNFFKVLSLLIPLIARDIRERYAGSVIGLFWTFIQPLLFILIFWLIFSQIIRVRIHSDTGEVPFFAFLLTGLLPWFAIQEGISRGASSVIERGYIIKKVFYPAELFAISSSLSSLVHNGMGFLLFIIGFLFYKGFSINMLFLLPLFVYQLLITVGLALFFSALAVYLRDILQILGAALQVVFYLSPVLYPVSSVPENLKTFLNVNPITWLINSYHRVVLYDKPPLWNDLVFLSIFSLLIFLLGLWVFRRLKKGFSDVL